jgi:hypothetical protein
LSCEHTIYLCQFINGVAASFDAVIHSLHFANIYRFIELTGFSLRA